MFGGLKRVIGWGWKLLRYAVVAIIIAVLAVGVSFLLLPYLPYQLEIILLSALAFLLFSFLVEESLIARYRGVERGSIVEVIDDRGGRMVVVFLVSLVLSFILVALTNSAYPGNVICSERSPENVSTDIEEFDNLPAHHQRAVRHTIEEGGESRPYGFDGVIVRYEGRIYECWTTTV